MRQINLGPGEAARLQFVVMATQAVFVDKRLLRAYGKHFGPLPTRSNPGTDNYPDQNTKFLHRVSTLRIQQFRRYNTPLKLYSRITSKSTRLKGIALTLLIIMALSCSPSPNRDVRDYLRLAVALGERDPDSLDFYYGQPNWLGDFRTNPPKFATIRDQARVLAERLNGSPRLKRQVQAIATRADTFAGGKLTFEQEAKIYFGLDIYLNALLRTNHHTNQADLQPIHSKLAYLLPGDRPLAQRYAAFDESFLIPSDKVPAVFSAALKGCRDQTRQHLKLPENESVTVSYVHDRPWSGFSHYQGNFRSLIEINIDLGLTVDRLLQLACHEGYPGHHAVNVLQDSQFVRASHQFDWMVQPTFGPQSLVSEGLATYAVQLAFPGDERLRFERDTLFPLAGLDPSQAAQYFNVTRLIDQLDGILPIVAADYLDGRLEWARAAAVLEDQALMTHPEETLKYWNEFRSYVLTYTVGKDLVAKRVTGDWKKYEALILDPEAASVIIPK
jgi:hypothetical protein